MGLSSKVIKRFFPRYIPASEQSGRLFHYPALEQEWVENAKLFAHRDNLLKHFAPQLAHGVIAEVGVMYGDFSELILSVVNPETFIAIDRFDAHMYPMIWGKPSRDIFKGLTHRDYYEKRLSTFRSSVRCEQGDSWACLSRLSNGSIDMIYIDAGHDYDSVKRDAEIAEEKIKPAGLLVFNDYIKYSHYDDCYYGVIPVVHHLLAHNGFEVAGFALNWDMYCDIAIRKRNH